MIPTPGWKKCTVILLYLWWFRCLFLKDRAEKGSPACVSDSLVPICRGMPELCWPPLLIIILLVRAVITRGFVGAAVPKEECKHPRSSSKNLQLWTFLECLSLLECVYSFRPISTLQSELPAYHYLALSGDKQRDSKRRFLHPDQTFIRFQATWAEQTKFEGNYYTTKDVSNTQGSYFTCCVRVTKHFWCWRQKCFSSLI